MCSARWTRTQAALLATCFCLTLNLKLGLAVPASNSTEYLQLFKYERHSRIEESSTTLASTSTRASDALAQTPSQHQPESELYTLQLSQHNQRQQKQERLELVYDYKCPKQHYIHPCDCLGG